MHVKAFARKIRMSPRKIRLVVDMIRGKKATDAVIMLRFIPRAAAMPVLKVLQSAMANAEHNFKLAKDKLYVKTIQVDGGPTIKRSRPRARGSAAPILKRTSHISIILEEKK